MGARKSIAVGVYVEGTTISFDKKFDYAVPFDMAEEVFVGQRVIVPFGRANKKRQGVIVDIFSKSESEIAKIKPIYRIIDKNPLVTEEMLLLADFIKNQTFCTFYEAFKPQLPIGINVNIVTSYTLAKDVDIEGLRGDCRVIAEALQKAGGKLSQAKLLEKLGKTDAGVFENLLKSGIIEDEQSAVRRVGDKAVKMVRISEGCVPSELRLTEKQQLVVEFLQGCEGAGTKEVCYFTGVTTAVLNTLIKNGVLTCYEEEVYRSPHSESYSKDGEKTEIALSDEQTAAYQAIKKDMGQSGAGKAGLLYGVTGSGKTQVFLKVIDDCVKSGKGVIVMVPEIALTPQTLNIFKSRYGDKIAVFHSAMALGQRTDEWKRVKNGDAQIAIGTRSAVFAPFAELGLVIMDEEQEHTYKSEATPRFHARDVAKFRCRYHNCMFLMASATPSVETYSQGVSGRISLYTLKNRYKNLSLPKVFTVDMKGQYKSGNFGIFSERLCDSLGDTIAAGKQAIILLNRRGYQVMVTCSTCNNVRKCENCSISLTYHSTNNRLMCHYCGYSEEYSDKCTVCGESNIRLLGFGTQKAEEELQTLFPDAKILRMDADTTLTRFSHERKLNAFAAGEYDIMVGTQMVAKGLDFPCVTLVGVINADQSLFGSDFKAYEKTFSLLTQVIGRSGRGESGTAVIQTIAPENEIISLSSEQDYERFYETEILSRKLLKYPPYSDLCVVGFSGVSREETHKLASVFFEKFKAKITGEYSDVKVIILGPGICNVPKINNNYRFRLIIKCRNSKRLREVVKSTLIDCIRVGKAKNISVFADINPENII